MYQKDICKINETYRNSAKIPLIWPEIIEKNLTSRGDRNFSPW